MFSGDEEKYADDDVTGNEYNDRQYTCIYFDKTLNEAFATEKLKVLNYSKIKTILICA